MQYKTIGFLLKNWKLLLAILVTLLLSVLFIFMFFLAVLYVVIDDFTGSERSVPANYRVSGLTVVASNEIPREHLKAFRDAGEEFNIPWTVIAAVAKHDTNFGQDEDKYMKFPKLENDNWGKYEKDGNYDDEVSLKNLYDASYTLANYLSKNNYRQSPVESLISIYKDGKHVEEILKTTEEYTDIKLPLIEGVWPIPGEYAGQVEITSTFGRRGDPVKKEQGVYEEDFHYGIDIGAPSGTPVRPPNNGEVIAAGWVAGYGKLINVAHDDNVVTYYAHLSEINVKRGDEVTPDMVIGEVGNTGKSTGPHLHFEVRVDGEPIDPEPWLK